MTRPLRIEYPGALYHVMSRGNAHQDIYLDDKDRRIFLKNLENCIETHHLICHAYCLMNNHYHLLLETPDGNLSKAMRNINGIYTQGFNRRHGRVGHILQGRYKAYLIEKETYLLEITRYIVLNPVRAGLVGQPHLWRWSSYRATSGVSKAPRWLHTDWVLKFFSTHRGFAQKLYRQFVKDTDAGNPYESLKEGVILGSPQFVSWIWEKTNGSENMKDIPRTERVVGRPTLDELFDGVKNLEERNAAIQLARNRCGYLISEISNHLNLDPSTVGKIACGKYHNE